MTADPVAAFAEHRERAAELVEQARSYTGLPASALGSLDAVDPLPGSAVPNVYARAVALTAQRVRYFSDQLAQAVEKHGVSALVRENLVYDPETSEVRVASETPTALADMEYRERRLLESQLQAAIRLGLQQRSAAERQAIIDRNVDLLESFAVEAGMDWAAPDTRRIAQRALLRAYGESPD